MQCTFCGGPGHIEESSVSLSSRETKDGRVVACSTTACVQKFVQSIRLQSVSITAVGSAASEAKTKQKVKGKKKEKKTAGETPVAMEGTESKKETRVVMENGVQKIQIKKKRRVRRRPLDPLGKLTKKKRHRRGRTKRIPKVKSTKKTGASRAPRKRNAIPEEFRSTPGNRYLWLMKLEHNHATDEGFILCEGFLQYHNPDRSPESKLDAYESIYTKNQIADPGDPSHPVRYPPDKIVAQLRALTLFAPRGNRFCVDPTTLLLLRVYDLYRSNSVQQEVVINETTSETAVRSQVPEGSESKIPDVVNPTSRRSLLSVMNDEPVNQMLLRRIPETDAGLEMLSFLECAKRTCARTVNGVTVVYFIENGSSKPVRYDIHDSVKIPDKPRKQGPYSHTPYRLELGKLVGIDDTTRNWFRDYTSKEVDVIVQEALLGRELDSEDAKHDIPSNKVTVDAFWSHSLGGYQELQKQRNNQKIVSIVYKAARDYFAHDLAQKVIRAVGYISPPIGDFPVPTREVLRAQHRLAVVIPTKYDTAEGATNLNSITNHREPRGPILLNVTNANRFVDDNPGWRYIYVDGDDVRDIETVLQFGEKFAFGDAWMQRVLAPETFRAKIEEDQAKAFVLRKLHIEDNLEYKDRFLQALQIGDDNLRSSDSNVLVYYTVALRAIYNKGLDYREPAASDSSASFDPNAKPRKGSGESSSYSDSDEDDSDSDSDGDGDPAEEKVPTIPPAPDALRVP